LNGRQPATLPRSARLLERADFEATLATGTVRRRRYFALYVRRNGREEARIGLITSKRVAPRAVDRNRAKRLVREAFRQRRHGLGGLDLVVQLRRCPGKDAAAELSRLLDNLGGLREGR